MSYTHFCVAKTFAGLESVLEKELLECGARTTQILNRAVSFQADNPALYACCWRVRTALKILVKLRDFKAGQDNIYYHQIRKINWNQYIGVDKSFVVDAVAVHSRVFNHSQYLAQKTKDGIVDRIRNDQGERPSVDKADPDIRVHVHVYQNQCQVYLDAGGDTLFKRGFARRAGHAPLNEVLAAGLLRLTDWDGEEPLLDPMCGLGTFLREAAAMARRISPYHPDRPFGIEKWPYFDVDLWNKIKKEAFANPHPLPPLFGRDVSEEAIQLTRYNLAQAGLSGAVNLTVGGFENLPASDEPGLLIMNPPYDERLPLENSRAFYRALGDKLKQDYTGWRAWIFSANLEGIKTVGLKPYKKHVLYNGPLKSRFHAYNLYQGSR